MKHCHNITSPCAFRLLAFLFVAPGSAFCQTTPITGDLTISGSVKSGVSNSTGGTELRLGGLVIANGIYNGEPALVSSDQGPGTRMLWYPGKAAFRAGSVDGTQWNDTSIGQYSTALGRNSQAAGVGAAALGYGSCAFGNWSTALGGGFAFGGNSIVLGKNSVSLGWAATAMGYVTTATGYYSTAMGCGSIATGTASLVMGYDSAATGCASTSLGMHTSSDSFSSVAIGSYNVGGGNPYSWVPTDSIFEIGNGVPIAPEGDDVDPYAATTGRSNALTVYKNGNMDVQGVVTCAPGGDIPMFTGN